MTEISAVAPDLEVECNDRLPSRNPPARNTATSLPEMPNSHDACAHLAGAYGIRTSHVRMLHMRPGRKNRYSVRSNEVRRCWLARWRIAAADVRSWRRPTLPQSPIERLDRALSLVAAFIVARDHSCGPDTKHQIRSLGWIIEIIEIRYHKGALRIGNIDRAGVRTAAALL